MKLEKKTAYRVRTQEDYNDMMKCAEEQGFHWGWLNIDKPTSKDYWNEYKEHTLVYVEPDESLAYGGDEDIEKARQCRYAIEDYVRTPNVVQITPWCVGVNAPNFEEAQAQLTHWLGDFMKRTNKEIEEKMFSEKCYTVRVDGRDVTVITPDGKTATAHCHPDDEFDIAEGVRIALEKIERKNHKLTSDEWCVLDFLDDMGCDTMYIDKGCCIYGEKDKKDIIDLSGESVKDLFDWLEDFESYDIDELMELDVED